MPSPTHALAYASFMETSNPRCSDFRTGRTVRRMPRGISGRDPQCRTDSFSSHGVPKRHRRLDRGNGVVSFVELASIMGASNTGSRFRRNRAAVDAKDGHSVVDIEAATCTQRILVEDNGVARLNIGDNSERLKIGTLNAPRRHRISISLGASHTDRPPLVAGANTPAVSFRTQFTGDD